MTSPGSKKCCEKNPSFPGCDPCKINPGGRKCCQSDPTFLGCDPCKKDPGSKMCCIMNSHHPLCN